jgi:hypothetical protein
MTNIIKILTLILKLNKICLVITLSLDIIDNLGDIISSPSSSSSSFTYILRVAALGDVLVTYALVEAP